jgi:hypothetical protein
VDPGNASLAVTFDRGDAGCVCRDSFALNDGDFRLGSKDDRAAMAAAILGGFTLTH